jgi:hypothetical protein
VVTASDLADGQRQRKNADRAVRGRGLTLCTSLLMGTLLLVLSTSVEAQLFFGARPHPGLMIGPLFVQASVSPERRDVSVEVIFSVVIPPGHSALEFEQDLYLLWPGEIITPLPGGPGNPSLTRAVEAHGLTSIQEGRLPLLAHRHYETSLDTEPLAGGVPFVTFVRTGGPLGLAPPATYIQIPWTPKLVNPAWLINLQFTAKGLIKPKPTTWVARTFSGARYLLALGFNDVGPPAMFEMYFWQRDRVIPITDPARLLINFARSDHLGVDEISPPASRRELSQSFDNTDLVSLFLGPIEGLTPQVLAVHFGYFSGFQSWGPIVVPALFFALGNFAGVIIRNLADRLRRRFAGRVRVGRWVNAHGSQNGIVVPRERLAEIVPGETSYDDVLRLCGREPEELDSLGTPARKTLVYRGRRLMPVRKWTCGWLTTVSRWEVEHHEVEINVEGGIVRDVQARIRRARREDLAPA